MYALLALVHDISRLLLRVGFIHFYQKSILYNTSVAAHALKPCYKGAPYEMGSYHI